MNKALPPNDEAEIAKILKPIFEDANAAPDTHEWFLRFRAARAAGKFIRFKYRSDEPNLWRTFAPVCYRNHLLDLKKRRCQVEKHFAKLEAKGIPHEDRHLYPFMDAVQRRQEREWLKYVRHCVKNGEPVPWENRRRK